jgi:hypothetical protein
MTMTAQVGWKEDKAPETTESQHGVEATKLIGDDSNNDDFVVRGRT